MKCEGTHYLFKKIARNGEAAGVRKKIKLRVESEKKINGSLWFDENSKSKILENKF